MIDASLLPLAREAVAKLDAGAALADITPEEVAASTAALRHAFDNDGACARQVAP